MSRGSSKPDATPPALFRNWLARGWLSVQRCMREGDQLLLGWTARPLQTFSRATLGRKRGGKPASADGTGSHEHVVGGKSICLGFSFCYRCGNENQRQTVLCLRFLLQQRADNLDAVPIFVPLRRQEFLECESTDVTHKRGWKGGKRERRGWTILTPHGPQSCTGPHPISAPRQVPVLA